MRLGSIVQHSSILFLLIATLILGHFSRTNAAETPRVNTTTATIDEQSADSFTFTLDIAEAALNADGKLEIAGLDGYIGDIGAPQLPYYRTLIGLPPEAEATVNLRIIGDTTKQTLAIQPVPNVDIPQDVNRMEITALEAFDLQYEQDAAIYTANEQFPSTQYSVSEPFYMRDRRLIELTVFPSRYNPVTNALETASSIEVEVTFHGANMRSVQPAANESGAFNGWGVLNAAQSADWRALPSTLTPASTTTKLPVGREAVKIEINTDGIYELTYADLAAFSSLTGSDPNMFQMLHRGEPVSFEVVGGGDNSFDSGDSIRFYGWAFDGTRAEKLHVTNNVFWLWADGSAARIDVDLNDTIGATPLTSWESTVAFEEDNYYLETNKRDWSSADAEPDLWYWQRFVNLTNNDDNDVNIVLPHPTKVGNATFTAEVFSLYELTSDHRVQSFLNEVAGDQRTWPNRDLKILSGTISASNLISGTNVLRLYADTAGSAQGNDAFHLNRVTVTYDRAFTATDDQLLFDVAAAGNHLITVDGFNGIDVDNFAIYDVTQPRTPTRILVGSTDITSGSSVQLGRNIAANSKFIAGKLIKPVSVTAYTVDSLEPPSGSGAQWVIVAPAIFNGSAQTLATHRANHNGLSTYVADYDDIINQYGYGLPTPAALRDYFKHGLTWTNPLEYVVLAGDATNNPRNRNCNKNINDSSVCPGLQNTNWQAISDQNHVLTDYQFVDVIVGSVPTDFTLGLLDGTPGDNIADIMLGRLPAQNITELNNMISKIVRYDNNLAAGASYMDQMIWLADNADPAGSFCVDTMNVQNNTIPNGLFTHTTYCLDDFGDTDSGKRLMRSAFFGSLNGTGAGVINYRGHGAVRNWASDFMSPTDIDGWANFTKPAVLISADCLDGYFTSMGEEALSELFISRGSEAGTAAHWSSVGLGFNEDHTKLQTAFYIGLYEQDLVTIGAAIQYAKVDFITNNSTKESEVYEFLLQGDPAMKMPKSLHTSYVPIVIR